MDLLLICDDSEIAGSLLDAVASIENSPFLMPVKDISSALIILKNRHFDIVAIKANVVSPILQEFTTKLKHDHPDTSIMALIPPFVGNRQIIADFSLCGVQSIICLPREQEKLTESIKLATIEKRDNLTLH